MRLCVVAVLASMGMVAAGSGLVAGDGRPDQEKPAGGSRTVFRSSVNLVYVPVTVMHAGKFVPDLTAADFSIEEDGKPQTIEVATASEVPLSLAIIVDTSASMQGQRLSDAFSSVRQLVHQAVGPEDEACLFVFGRGPVLLQRWTDKQTLLDGRFRVPQGSGTPLYETLRHAAQETRQAKHPRRVILAVSNGASTDGWRRTPGPAFQPPVGTNLPSAPAGVISNPSEPSAEREEALELIKNRDVMLYAIGMGTEAPGGSNSAKPASGVDAQELRRITEMTGGYAEIVGTGGELGAAVVRLGEELKHQYLLGYVSPRATDGKYHEIRVAVKSPEYQVRARRGYHAGARRR